MHRMLIVVSAQCTPHGMAIGLMSSHSALVRVCVCIVKEHCQHDTLTTIRQIFIKLAVQ